MHSLFLYLRREKRKEKSGACRRGRKEIGAAALSRSRLRPSLTDPMRALGTLLFVAIWLLGLCRLAAGAGVLAIDLGSENLKMSLVKPGVPFDVLMNRDSKRKTPATITLRGDDRWVGGDAANLVKLLPSSLSIF
jgi:hypothetical protein